VARQHRPHGYDNGCLEGPQKVLVLHYFLYRLFTQQVIFSRCIYKLLGLWAEGGGPLSGAISVWSHFVTGFLFFFFFFFFFFFVLFCFACAFFFLLFFFLFFRRYQGKMGAPQGWYGEEECIRPVESRTLERNRILSFTPPQNFRSLPNNLLFPPPISLEIPSGAS